MSFIIKPEEIVLGEANIFTLDIELLLNQELVKNSEYFSNSDNWKYVYISYENSIGQYNNLIFDISKNKLTASFDPSIKADASSNWNIMHIVIRDFDGLHLKINRSDLTVADFDIALGSVGGVSSQFVTWDVENGIGTELQFIEAIPDGGLVKTNGSQSWKNVIPAVELIPENSDGYIEVTYANLAESDGSVLGFGSNLTSSYSSITFNLNVVNYGGGLFRIFNINSPSDIVVQNNIYPQANDGDTFRIAREGSSINYYKNYVDENSVPYATQPDTTNGAKLYVASSFFMPNTTIRSVKIGFDISLGSVDGDISSLIFDFDGFATASDITDTTGNISTTSVGASLVDDRNGKVLTKIGRHDHLLVPAQGILQGSEFTISMWYNGLQTNDSIFSISSVPRGQYGIGPGDIFSGMAFYVYGTNKQVQFMLVDNNSYQGENSNVTSSPFTIVESIWIKFDITIGNSELKLYQDGQLISSSSYDPNSLSNILSALNNTADSEIVLLNSVVPNLNEYQNYMDDFKIISRVLTDEEILDNYNSSAGGDVGTILFSNSLHHSTNVVISNDQLTANFPTLDYGHALSDNTEILSGQKFYAEFVINSVGILELGFSFYDTVPDVVNTTSRYPSNLKLMVSLNQNGHLNYGNNSSSSGINKVFNGWDFVEGDTIGIAIDTAAQEVYVKKNGVWLPNFSWLGPSNPETGTDGSSYAGYGNATNGDTVYLSVWGRKNINDSSITLVSDPTDIPVGYKLLGS